MIQQLESVHPLLAPALGIVLLLAVAVVVDLVAKRVLVRAARRFAENSRVTWDDALVAHNVFGRLSQVLPALVVFLAISFVPGLPEALVRLVRNVATGYMVLMLTMTLTSLLSAANTIYSALPVAKERPLKGFVQLVQIVVWVLGGVLIVAAVLDRSPLLLISGFGAMTAILLLVFKDTILSLVASVQLTAQDMVRVGDWITMPQFGADGDVIDVQLHTVKVQN
ncbi:MAG TPA: mechanosensitive ion channel family protein, partial [Woeseiaceae bacterium]|nr:mechanosensitive ion channel family protein [Woeseiaceae bacterium]